MVRFQLPQPARKRLTTIHFCKGGIIETTSVTAASLLTSASTVLVSGVGVVWDMVTGNPLLALFVGASIVSLGFSFFRKAKRSAR